MRFAFYPGCGGTVLWEAEIRPGAKGIPAGLFADPDLPPPRVSIFTEERVAWVTVPDGVEQRIGHGTPTPAPKT